MIKYRQKHPQVSKKLSKEFEIKADDNANCYGYTFKKMKHRQFQGDVIAYQLIPKKTGNKGN